MGESPHEERKERKRKEREEVSSFVLVLCCGWLGLALEG